MFTENPSDHVESLTPIYSLDFSRVAMIEKIV